MNLHSLHPGMSVASAPVSLRRMKWQWTLRLDTLVSGAWQWKENADAADLRQADYLESDSFFKLVKHIPGFGGDF